MNTKKLFLAGIVGFVVMFSISGLWYMLLMSGFYETEGSAVNKAEVSFLFIALGYLVMSFLMAYVYPFGYKGGPPVKEGLRFGIVMGLLIWLSANLVLYGAYNVTLSMTLVDSVYHIVEEGIGGLVIALIYGSTEGGQSS